MAAACSARAVTVWGEDRFQHSPAWQEPIDLRNGVSGYVIDTVRAVLEIVREHPTNYRAAVSRAVEMGGDTDTVAAIVGGIVCARVGHSGIPAEWLDRLMEPVDGVPWPLVPLRNFAFLAIVLVHGFRRLLPPY